MVEAVHEAHVESVARRLRLIGQPVRIRIVGRLVAQGESTVHSLAGVVGVSQQAMSWHLGLLHQAGIVARRQEGRLAWYSVADPRVLPLLKQAEAQIVDCGRPA